jgi:hypothetical protein
MSDERAAAYVREYLTLQRAIAGLEERAADARQAAIECLAADGAEPGFEWKFAGLGSVIVVNGRKSPKQLQRAILAKAGVDPALLDAATTGGVPGKPGIRILPEGAKVKEDGDGA